MNEAIHELRRERMTRRKLNQHRANLSIARDMDISPRSVMRFLAGEVELSGRSLRLVELLLHLERHGKLSIGDLERLSA